LTKASEHNNCDTPGEIMFLDLTSFKPPKKELVIPQPNWRLMVDECTNFKITHFFKKKNEMVEPTFELIKRLKDKNMEIKFLHMDNAGENPLLEARCKSKDWQFGIEFEYTARATHQHNQMAELGFATLGNNGRALTVKANIPKNTDTICSERYSAQPLTLLDWWSWKLKARKLRDFSYVWQEP
jgi:hypothetical protein